MTYHTLTGSFPPIIGLSIIQILVLFSLAASCRTNKTHNSENKSVGESRSFYAEKIITENVEALPLDASLISDLIDIRGVGDSGWVDRNARPKNVTGTPVKAEFGAAMLKLDPEKIIFASDLSFINWEAVITKRCKSVRTSVSFAFYSHPDNILQAANHGFNQFGLSNNHSGDCNLDDNGLNESKRIQP